MNYQKIENIVNDVLTEEKAFLVRIKVNDGNNIVLNVDSFDGMTFQRLKMINRKIEALLDRDEEDFSLTVSSPGLDQPFRVHNQYVKNVNRSVKVAFKDGAILVGKLTEVTDDNITVVTKATKKEKSKTEVIAFSDVLETKVEIEF